MTMIFGAARSLTAHLKVKKQPFYAVVSYKIGPQTNEYMREQLLN